MVLDLAFISQTFLGKYESEITEITRSENTCTFKAYGMSNQIDWKKNFTNICISISKV